MPLPVGAFGPITGTPSAPQFCEVAFLGHTVESGGETKPCNQITHWRCLTPLPGGSLTTLLTNIAGGIDAQYAAIGTTDYVLDIVRGKFLDSPLSMPVDYTDGTAGSVNVDRAASFTAGVIRKKTGVPSRHYRGSLHYGAVPESFTTKDYLNSTGLAAYANMLGYWNGIIATGVSDGAAAWYPIVLSKTLSNLFANPSIFYGAAVTSFTQNTKLGTMKRRKEKAGAA